MSESKDQAFLDQLAEPKEREFLIEQIGVKGYPIVAFGAGGVAKSFAMLSAGIAIASDEGVDKWLGLQILEHGHVLYLDFELAPDEQHRRVRDLCAGMGVPISDRLAYISGVGILPETAFRAALAHVKGYGGRPSPQLPLSVVRASLGSYTLLGRGSSRPVVASGPVSRHGDAAYSETSWKKHSADLPV